MMTRSPQEKSIFAVKHGKTSVYKTNTKYIFSDNDRLAATKLKYVADT